MSELGLVSSIDKAKLDYLTSSLTPVEINASYTLSDILKETKNITISESMRIMLNENDPSFKYFNIKFSDTATPISFLISSYNRGYSVFSTYYNRYYVVSCYNSKPIYGEIIVSPEGAEPVISVILESYSSSDYKQGSLVGFSPKSTYIGKWIRIALIINNPYLACNFSISKSWIGSVNAGITFTLTGGIGSDANNTQCSIASILQTGCNGNLFKKVRLLWKSNSAMYLELFVDSGITTSDWIFLGCDLANATYGRQLVTLYNNPTVTTSIPSGYYVLEYKFFKNDFLSLKNFEDFTFDSEYNVNIRRTTVINAVCGYGTLNLKPPYNGWEPGTNYTIYISGNTGNFADPITIKLYQSNSSVIKQITGWCGENPNIIIFNIVPETKDLITYTVNV